MADLSEAFSYKGLNASIHDVYAVSETLGDTMVTGYLKEDGFSYGLYKDISEQLTIIILSNYRHPVSDEMINGIHSIINEEPYQLPLLRKPIKVSADVIQSYAGEYLMNENMSIKVIVENNSLYAMMGNKIPLVPQSEKQFYTEAMDASMRFLKNEQGEVYAVELLDGFINGTICKKIN